MMKATNHNSSKNKDPDNSTLAHTKRVHAEASKLIADCRKKDAEMMASVRAAQKK